MKQMIIIGALLDVGVRQADAQTIPTMLQQLASLEQLRATTQKGYNAVFNGLHEIRNIKQEEYYLQEAYFVSLSEMNPTMKVVEPSTLESMQLGILDSIYKAVESYEAIEKRALKRSKK